jgi:hypothetical protein
VLVDLHVTIPLKPVPTTLLGRSPSRHTLSSMTGYPTTSGSWQAE